MAHGFVERKCLWFAKTPSEARPLRISNILDNPKSSAPNLFGRDVTMLHRNGFFPTARTEFWRTTSDLARAWEKVAK